MQPGQMPQLPANFWERMFAPDITADARHMVMALGAVYQQLLLMGEQLSEVTALLAAGAGRAGSGGSLPIAQVSVPIAPRSLIEAILARGLGGDGYISIEAFEFLVPAGGEVPFIAPPPAGYVTILLNDPVIDADTYSAGIRIVEGTINGRSVIGTLGVQISTPVPLPGAQYEVIKQEGLEMLIVNPSTIDARVLFQGTVLHLRDAFYQSFLEAAMNFSYDQLKALIAVVPS